VFYYGIDCGLKGGLVCISDKGKLVITRTMPVIVEGKKSRIDISSLAVLFADLGQQQGCQTFIVENPGGHAPSAQGLRSMTYSFAVIEALLVNYGLKYHTVTARTWQKEFWQRPKLPTGVKFDTKQAALLAANNLWPSQSWLPSKRHRKPHDGLVDAALLAEYGRRKELNG